MFVVAPAIAFAACGYTAGMSVTRADRNEIKSAGNWDRDRAIGLRAIAELAGNVRAPTIGATVIADGTGKQCPCTHRRKGVPTNDRNRSGARGFIAIAELSVIVTAPAVNRPIGRQSAAVIKPCTHCSEWNPSRYGDGRPAPFA